MKRKGSEKIISFWNILIWIVVAVGFIIAVVIFNSQKTDVRDLEANLLSERIYDCVIFGDQINNRFVDRTLTTEKINWKGECGLLEMENLYGRVRIYQGTNLLKTFYYGVRSFEVFCDMETTRGEGAPACVKKQVNALERIPLGGEQVIIGGYRVEIVAGSGNL